MNYNPAKRMAIVAAPQQRGKERSILLSIDQRGAVEALHLTSSEAVVRSPASAGTDPLWIIPKHSRWLPFVKMSEGASARFRRLYDDHSIDMPPERHEQR